MATCTAVMSVLPVTLGSHRDQCDTAWPPRRPLQSRCPCSPPELGGSRERKQVLCGARSGSRCAVTWFPTRSRVLLEATTRPFCLLSPLPRSSSASRVWAQPSSPCAHRRSVSAARPPLTYRSPCGVKPFLLPGPGGAGRRGVTQESGWVRSGGSAAATAPHRTRGPSAG